jgi:hypothetical protein
MSARVGAIVFPNPYTVYPDSPRARFIFFLVFVLGKKKEESEKPKREEEQRR